MEAILPIIVVAVAAALLLARPETPQTQVIYVPLAVEEPQGSGLGCLMCTSIPTALSIINISKWRRCWNARKRGMGPA